MDVGVAGAVVADGLLAGALTIDRGRVRSHDPPSDDPLLAKVAASIDRRVRPPRVRTVVELLARPRIRAEVRDRLVARSVLAPQRRRVLGVVPTTRFPVADAHTAAVVRHEVASLATAEHDPGEVTERQQLLVALAGSVAALDLLVDEPRRALAHERAAAMTPHDELISAVDAAAEEAQAFLVAGAG